MAMFLPKPQEFSYSNERLAPGAGLTGFISAWDGDDATVEVLKPALERFLGRGVEIAASALAGKPGCSFALAADAAAAAKLVEMAVAQMAKPVPTLTLCLDGGNMSEPMDGMGKVKAPAEGVANLPEAYTLVINAQGIAVAGADRAGLFYGVQTLVQALDGVAQPPSAGKVKVTPEGGCATLPGLLIRDFPSQAWRGIHFDMKYNFYRVETLHEQLRELGALKLNRALFEYEDKFPYQRHPEIVDQKLALTLDQVAALRRTAARHHVQIIPLIQTLGHLEFALKHKKLAHLREVPDGCTMMCPQKPEAQQFVRDLADEVLAAHPEAKVLHIGGDETTLLGYCPKCKELAAQHGPVSLWVDHYAPLTQYILDKGVRPILWDDIVRREASLAKRLPKGIIFTYWIYETVRERHGERKIPKALEDFYASAGKRPAELPDTLSTYPYYDYFRLLGFDIVAVPCYNAGTMVPGFELTARNTATWAEKNNLCGGLGMINSSWACFLMHPDAGWYGVAQTADNTWWWPSVNRLDLDARFGEHFFGLRTPEVAECLAAVSPGVGMPSKLHRPLSILSFAYMENVIHFEGNMEARRKHGAAIPGGLDVRNHLLRKLELMEEDNLQGEILRQLDYVQPIVESAERRLKALRPRVTRNREMIELFTCFARLKALRCRDWRLFIEAFAGRQFDHAHGGPEQRRMGRAAPLPTDVRANKESSFLRAAEDIRSRAAALLVEERRLRRTFLRLHKAKLCTPDAQLVTNRHFDGEISFLSILAQGQPIPKSHRTEFATMSDKGEDVKDF